MGHRFAGLQDAAGEKEGEPTDRIDLVILGGQARVHGTLKLFELEPVPGAVVLPHWTVTCVAEAPRGAHPSYAQGYYDRDNEAYRAWDPIARDRERFQEWLEEVYGAVQSR